MLIREPEQNRMLKLERTKKKPGKDQKQHKVNNCIWKVLSVWMGHSTQGGNVELFSNFPNPFTLRGMETAKQCNPVSLFM